MKLDGMINIFLVPICVSKCLDASNLRNHIIMACSLLQERQFGICIQLMIPQNSRCCCLHILCLFRQFRNILRKFFEARVLRMAVFPIMGIQMLEINAILLSCLLSNTECYDFMHSSILYRISKLILHNQHFRILKYILYVLWKNNIQNSSRNSQALR